MAKPLKSSQWYGLCFGDPLMYFRLDGEQGSTDVLLAMFNFFAVMTLRLLFCLFVCFCFPKRLLLSSFFVNTLVCPLQSCYWKYVSIASIRTWSYDARWWIARLRHGNRSSTCRIILKQKLSTTVGFWILITLWICNGTLCFFTAKHLDPKRQLSFVPLQMSPASNFRKAQALIGVSDFLPCLDGVSRISSNLDLASDSFHQDLEDFGYRMNFKQLKSPLLPGWKATAIWTPFNHIKPRVQPVSTLLWWLYLAPFKPYGPASSTEKLRHWQKCNTQV